MRIVARLKQKVKFTPSNLIKLAIGVVDAGLEDFLRPMNHGATTWLSMAMNTIGSVCLHPVKKEPPIVVNRLGNLAHTCELINKNLRDIRSMKRFDCHMIISLNRYMTADNKDDPFSG
ncbi:predicted protein [Sclerotinia sclerotiorum 1980 UF-70]|uniref:Uncharacterized protein n=1 Tax=Sclerotinia sclerotiorum (strain ATCC 18683 / 1980 / Ss-1) TaxID=665079 RepID=A7EJ27_SCLS1|nr:predicted protein [Sclerotinia sclerotiorum 1980 UF-70]EDO02843.1 predicted protein [Sclerotinia sclerotiorum 1980 UF-70]